MPSKKMKFRVNDVIIGNDRNTYSITKRGIKCEVVSVQDSTILVRVLEGIKEGSEHYVVPEQFDLVKEDNPAKPTIRNPKYTMEHDNKLGVTFLRVGDVTVAIPLPENEISVSVKHPDDSECPEIGKAMSYYRLAKVRG